MRARANVVVGAVLAVVLVAAIAALVATRPVAGDAEGLRAVVHDGDGGVHELSLAQDSETTIETSFGTNVIVVRDGAVFVGDADCDNHDCMHQGELRAPGRQIICLPHRLWIEVVAQGETGAGGMDVDAAAGGEGDFDAVAR